MFNFVFSHKNKDLPEFSDEIHPVLMYSKDTWHPNRTSCIARTTIDSIRDTGVRIEPKAFDFFSIAMAVTAADSFAPRDYSPNAWARRLSLTIPLFKPEFWQPVKNDLEKCLGFLTGDEWSLTFIDGGMAPPAPKASRKVTLYKKTLRGKNCVSLFSGGLDSTVGAIDLLKNTLAGYAPLLVSHAYKGDAAKQREIEGGIKGLNFARLKFNADPHLCKNASFQPDISMRGRSFNFIAMAIIGLAVLNRLNNTSAVKSSKIFVPENGYISLNPPLTRRRIGSLSTRTTHPYFLSTLEAILSSVGFDVQLINPYQFKTKGEMLTDCADPQLLEWCIPHTVSCSNWHRKGIQCGRCVPCLIRRASISFAGIRDHSPYDQGNLKAELAHNDNTNDDLLSLLAAYSNLKSGVSPRMWVRQSGPLPMDISTRNDLFHTFERGLLQTGDFIKQEIS